MTKKKSHEEEIKRGFEELRTLGVPVDDASAAVVPRLRDQVGKSREADLAVAFLLGRIAEGAALEALKHLERATTDKEIQREIRRSLYKLAQKGLTASDPDSRKPEPQRVTLNLAPDIEAYLSSVDGSGGRLVWLARPQAGSGLQLLQGMVSDREGLVRVGGTVVRRKELRRMAHDIKERHGVTMISVPWEYADQILCEAFEKAKTLGRSGLDDFTSLRSLFNRAKPKPAPHPVYARLKDGELRSGAWRELSRRLFEEPEFRPWILDEDWMQPYLEQVQEAQGSRLVLNEVQKEERFAVIVRDAVREIFSGDRGRIFQRRMEDMALYLLETGREPEARLLLAVALQLAEGDPGPLDISFLSGLVQKSLAFYLSQAKEKASEEASLIVKP